MLKNIKAYSGYIGFFSIIVILAFIFHYPIQIIDALSSDSVAGYGINISTLRIIFEPFIGSLLFYLRTDQVLIEFAVLLFWILSLTFIISIVSQIFNNERKGFKPVLYSILSWLKKAVLIIGIWLGLLIYIIFGTMPANTIVNTLDNTILVNTHSHSEYSHDGIISQKNLLKWHKNNKFDAFFITDHNHHEKTFEAVKAQENGTLPSSPLIIAGEEFSGSNHMTLLGLKRNFITRGLSDQQVIDSTHDDKGVVIVAHWFDGERESIPFFLNLDVDGFEIANQAVGLEYEKRIFNNIVEACTSNGLIMNGVTDYHGYGSTCFTWNALDIPDWHAMDNIQKRESILDILRQKDMSKIKVLLYNDRVVFDRSQVLLSPVYTFISYFRTLNFLQLLSWLIWVIIMGTIRTSLINRNKIKVVKIKSIQIMETITFPSSLYLLFLGINLLSKVKPLADFNDIYAEYGIQLVWAGSFFLIYTTILVLIELRKYKNEKNII